MARKKFKQKDKDFLNDLFVAEFYREAQTMFEYENLPDTIPKINLEKYLMGDGCVCITEVNGDLYAFGGGRSGSAGLGGELDAYYRPTLFTVANPYLKYEAVLRIGVECEIILNDSKLQGLEPFFRTYADLMTESIITMRIANIQYRLPTLISANDDRTAETGKTFMEDVEKGKLTILAGKNFLGESLSAYPYANTNDRLTELIEYHQYLRAAVYNIMGLNATFNMKREYISESENGLNHSALHAIVDDMLYCRQMGIELVNKMYGTNISVKLGGVWNEDRKLSGQPENSLENFISKFSDGE